MDLVSAFTYINDECETGSIIYVAIGCSVERYAPSKHPPQQYPPYLHAFNCPQICVLIDPRLEMPPRAYADVAAVAATATKSISGDITILPVIEDYNHTSYYGESTSWFLDKLSQLCLTKRVQLIVQDFTGTNIHPFYPIHHGRKILKKVLYDPTYKDGNCDPDMSAIKVFRDEEGGFIQPMYSPLNELRWVSHDVFKAQFKLRTYPTLNMLLRLYKIMRGFAEPKDWCTEATVETHLRYYSFIYDITSGDFTSRLRQTLMASLKDICIMSGKPLSDVALYAIVDSAGDEMETMWKALVI